jgi:hypothetical protein
LNYQSNLTATSLQQNSIEGVASENLRVAKETKPLQGATEEGLGFQDLLDTTEAVDQGIDWDWNPTLTASALQEPFFEDAASDKSRVVTETEPSPHDMDEEGLGEVDLLQDLFDGEDADVVNQGNDLDLGTKKEPPPSDTGGDDFAYTTDDELAAFLLSTLTVIDRNGITKDEEAREKEMLTDEEKAKLLVDAFGNMCLDEQAPQKKRAKQDLDPSSISFLVRQK